MLLCGVRVDWWGLHLCFGFDCGLCGYGANSIVFSFMFLSFVATIMVCLGFVLLG